MPPTPKNKGKRGLLCRRLERLGLYQLLNLRRLKRVVALPTEVLTVAASKDRGDPRSTSRTYLVLALGHGVEWDFQWNRVNSDQRIKFPIQKQAALNFTRSRPPVRAGERGPPFATGAKFREKRRQRRQAKVRTIRVPALCPNPHNGRAKACQ